MKSATLAGCAGLALVGAAWLGANPVVGAAAESEHLATTAAVSPVAASTEGAADGERGLWASPAQACVQDFSKDICDSEVGQGHLFVDFCPGTGCRTAAVLDAPLILNLRHNPQTCTSGPSLGRCDETIAKDGRLDGKINYTLRINEACKLRGVLDGQWKHRADDGTLYEGTVTGTLGVGTHRAFQCQMNTSRQCERCLDVEFLPQLQMWRIGVEASFVGTRVTPGLNQEDLRFTLSGDFYAPGDANGPFNLGGGWRFAGTADGAHISFCF